MNSPKTLIYVLLLILSINTAYSAKYGKYKVLNDSKLWLEGSSNVNEFECKSLKIAGDGELDTLKQGVRVVGVPFEIYVKAKYKINVLTLDCGNSSMNDDMYEALKFPDYNSIIFELVNIKIDSINQKSASYVATVAGKLSVAGKSKLISMRVKISNVIDNTYRIEGNTEILMTDFGIEAPSAMFGLIKAKDKINFYVDIKVSN